MFGGGAVGYIFFIMPAVFFVCLRSEGLYKVVAHAAASRALIEESVDVDLVDFEGERPDPIGALP